MRLRMLSSTLTWKWLQLLFGVYVVESLTLLYSVIAFALIYYSYVPTVTVEKDVDLLFDTDCLKHSVIAPGLCNFPSGNFSLTNLNGFPLLTFGHPYTAIINLKLPNSARNRDAGMGIMALEFFGQNGTRINQFRKPFSLPYKSSLLQTFHNLLYLPLYIFGSLKEESSLTLEMASQFEQPIAILEGRITMESRQFTWSSLHLGIYARLTSFQSYLYYYPQLAFLICVSLLTYCLNSIYIIIAIAYLIWSVCFKVPKPETKQEQQPSLDQPEITTIVPKYDVAESKKDI